MEKGDETSKGSLLRMKEKAAQLRDQISDIQNGNKPNRKQKKDKNAPHRPSPLSRVGQPTTLSPTKKGLGSPQSDPGGCDAVSGSSGITTPVKSEKNLQTGSPRLVSTAPVVGRKKCQGAAPGGIAPDVLQQIEGLQSEVECWQNEVVKARQEVEQRQDSYMRREDHLQKVLYGMQLEIDNLKNGDKRKAAPGGVVKKGTFGEQHQFIVDVHQQILEGIQNLLDKQKIHMKREEAIILRNFKDRVKALEEELFVERSSDAKTGDSIWLDKAMQLREELEEMKDMATKLDARLKESEELREVYKLQYKTQVEKEDELLKQTVHIKKENQQLKSEVASLRLEAERLEKERTIQSGQKQACSVEDSSTARRGRGPTNSEEVIVALKKRLTEERRRCSQARAAHTHELKRRTDLQSFLCQCIEDVRGKRKQLECRLQAASRRPQSAYHISDTLKRNRQLEFSTSNGHGKPRPTSAFVPGQHTRRTSSQDGQEMDDILDTDEVERENIINQLMSREEVLKMLFHSSFPDKPIQEEVSSLSTMSTQNTLAKSWQKNSRSISRQFLSGAQR